MPRDPSPPGPILVLGPAWFDMAGIRHMVGELGVSAQPMNSLAALCTELKADGGAATAALFIAEEALVGKTEELAHCLACQPPWSDLPVVVFAADGPHHQ